MNKVKLAKEKGFRITLNGECISPTGEKVGFVHKGYLHFSFRHKGEVVNVAVHRLHGYQKFGEKMFN